MNSIYFILLIGLFSRVHSDDSVLNVRIYSNLAEFNRPVSQLPLEFTEDEWNAIRSDSLTFVGNNFNVTLQTITEKKKSYNGTQVYIRSPLSSSDKKADRLIKAILIDEDKNLVQVHDPTIGVGDDEILYFTVKQNEIFYLEQPAKTKYYVDVKYIPKNAKIHVSYFQTNVFWRTQYQLNLFESKSELITMANIRNDGKLPLKIGNAVLISGDINLSSEQLDKPLRKSRFSNEFAAQHLLVAAPVDQQEIMAPTVGEGAELAGVFSYLISEPFVIEGKTNYLLPMFRPSLSVERYGSISKLFSTISTVAKAQRSYRLVSDRYLPSGNAVIRDYEQIVGEILLPNIAAKEKYEFSIGEDMAIVYKENVTLISTRTFNETEVISQTENNKVFMPIMINTRTESTYKINLEVKNLKEISSKIEYEQKGLHIYHKYSFKGPNQYHFVQDASSIKTNLTLKPNEIKTVSYTLSIVR